MSAKTCSACGQTKDEVDFYSRRRKCKACVLEHQRTHKKYSPCALCGQLVWSKSLRQSIRGLCRLCNASHPTASMLDRNEKFKAAQGKWWAGMTKEQRSERMRNQFLALPEHVRAHIADASSDAGRARWSGMTDDERNEKLRQLMSNPPTHESRLAGQAKAWNNDERRVMQRGVFFKYVQPAWRNWWNSLTDDERSEMGTAIWDAIPDETKERLRVEASARFWSLPRAAQEAAFAAMRARGRRGKNFTP
jgi:hypothetical protein